MSHDLPFNADKEALAEVRKLIKEFEIKTFIETGMNTGRTTKAMAKEVENVVTIECNLTTIEKYRFELPNVEIVPGRSEKELPQVIQRVEKPIFFYLDAHWGGNPILLELECIRASGLKPVIMIHDFIVAGKRGSDVLKWEYIKESIEEIYEGKYMQYFNKTGLIGICYIVPNGIS